MKEDPIMGGSKGSRSRREGRDKAAWTFTVYLAGDNNLTEEMTWGLQEMKKACGRPELTEGSVNVIAHFDPRMSRGRKYCFTPRDDERPAVQATDDGNLEEFERLVYTDAFVAATAPRVANPAARQLTAFLADQIDELARAEQYFVVLSGHGSGAIGDFLTDLDPGTSLSIPELGRILALARSLYWEKARETEPDGARKRIAILGMDSCLMSTAEVCYEVRDHAHFLVASEGWVANAGWPYHRVLEALVDPEHPAAAATHSIPNAATGDPLRERARRVAVRVADRYTDFYRDFEISDISTDIAVCDLASFRSNGEKRSTLVEALRHLAAQCIPQLEELYAWELLDTPGHRELENVRTLLAKQISDDLGNPGLEQRLQQGSTDAVESLSSPELSHRLLTPSRARALVGLLDSLDGTYHVTGQSLKTRLEAHRDELAAVLKPHDDTIGQTSKTPSVSTALAAARVIREFDPAVQEALRSITKKETQGDARGMKARVRLQKWHQALLRLDLHARLNPEAHRGDEAAPLRDALMAARWEAQSFKGGLYVDLFDFCECLSRRGILLPDFRKWVTRITEAIGTDGDRTVVLSRYTGPAFQHAHGLSIYLPVDARDFAPEYDNLALARVTGWGRFVRAYLQSTRRRRRDEGRHWAHIDDRVIRTGEWEVDPLESDTIEGRIADVMESDAIEELMPENVRTGTERRIREGTERRIREGTERKIREGTERKIRTGTERRIRTGTERKIKGESVLAVLGNPPDGFYRHRRDPA